jgi:hypothetical protein
MHCLMLGAWQHVNSLNVYSLWLIRSYMCCGTGNEATWLQSYYPMTKPRVGTRVPRLSDKYELVRTVGLDQ